MTERDDDALDAAVNKANEGVSNVPDMPTVGRRALPPGATTPVSFGSSLNIEAARKAATTTSTMSAPKRRGRPPLPRDEHGNIIRPNTPNTGGPSGSVPTGKEGGADTRAKERAKEARANDIATKIVNDGNEAILTILVMQGVPAELLWKVPPELKSAENDSLTPLGNLVAVKPVQAKRVANFLVELDDNESAGKVMNAASNPTVRLMVKGGLAAYAIVQYLNQVRQLRDKMAPLLQQWQAAKVQAEQMRAANIVRGSEI